MRKVLARIDNNGNLIDDNESVMIFGVESVYKLKDAPSETFRGEITAKLIGLGVTPDEVIKLKHNGLI
jgi:hypothetical protein